MAALAVGLAGFLTAGVLIADAQTAANIPKQKEFRIERSMAPQAIACLECHKQEQPGVFGDWAMSRHANANITCYDCHKAEEFDPDVSITHYKQYERSDNRWGIKEYRVPVAAVVTPKDCSRCHPDEARQHARNYMENRSLAQQGHEQRL